MTTTRETKTAKTATKDLRVGMQVSLFRETWTVMSINKAGRRYEITLINERTSYSYGFSPATKWTVQA